MKASPELIERLNDALAREMRAQTMYSHYAAYVKGIHRLHLKPFFDATFALLKVLQDLGVAPGGDPKLLFNMIRLSSCGLLALGNELKESSGIDVEKEETLDDIADMIVSVFLPGEVRRDA